MPPSLDSIPATPMPLQSSLTLSSISTLTTSSSSGTSACARQPVFVWRRADHDCHSGCGGVKAAMEAAKSRVATRYQSEPQNSYIKTAVTPHEYSGDGYLTKWLAPLRSLAVAQLRAANSSDAPKPITGVDDEEEAHRLLVRTHCCTQVANIESSGVVAEAARRGREITVDGWYVLCSTTFFLKCSLTSLQGLRCRHRQACQRSSLPIQCLSLCN